MDPHHDLPLVAFFIREVRIKVGLLHSLPVVIRNRQEGNIQRAGASLSLQQQRVRPGQAEVVSDTSGVDRVSAHQLAQEGRMRIRADQAVRVRPAVLEMEALHEFFISVFTHIHRIQEASVNKAETDAADFQLILQREGFQPRMPFRPDLLNEKRIVIRV